MESTDTDKVYRLVVTGPARERLYERFQRLFYGRGDVEVVCDRRKGERRWSDGHMTPERRTHERRHRVTWVVPPE
jgi:hypothetical protein